MAALDKSGVGLDTPCVNGELYSNALECAGYPIPRHFQHTVML